ncbi:RCC1 and BTB domain-containing protein 1-like [Dermatophagoides pteronyssinus]|uniref:RCC1 and BTB domain-containing protein 1-like n=1 Tax=Dermatophagoides pteronyssinus TaxID=6956 RepID=UPI003F67ADFC
MLSLKHDSSKPQKIYLLNYIKIVQVDFGDNFVVLLTNDGHVYVASDDYFWNTKKTFKLLTDINDNNDRFKMIACGTRDLLLLRKDGTVFKSTQTLNSNRIPLKCIELVEGLKNVKLIACGPDHYFALTNREKLYGQSHENDSKPKFFQFPRDSINSRIKDIAFGEYFSLFLLENGELYFCGKDLTNTDIYSSSKLVLGQVERIATTKYSKFALAYSKSSYYVWGKIYKHHWSSFTKLNAKFESFAAVVEKFTPSPLTFDNYDVEFIVGQQKQRILACKFYLKSVSEYFCKMLSGKWLEKDRIIIDSYSYDTYYSYLNKLHCGDKDSIKINANNIGEFTDLAHCYCDQELIGYCKNFIRNDLNEKTIQIYLPIISKYQFDEFNDKLRQITFENLKTLC